jgi:hypothetical protein
MQVDFPAHALGCFHPDTKGVGLIRQRRCIHHTQENDGSIFGCVIDGLVRIQTGRNEEREAGDSTDALAMVIVDLHQRGFIPE